MALPVPDLLTRDDLIEQALDMPDLEARKRLFQDHIPLLDDECAEALKAQADQFLRSDIQRCRETAQLLIYQAELNGNPLHRALGLLAEANAQGFEPLWLGALPSYVSLLALGNPDLYTNFYVALDTPNFTDTDVPGMATFLERWEAFGDGDPNTFHLSGYFQSIAIHALLEDAVAAGDLGRDGLQQALADLGEVDVQGLADNYVYGTPENRIPARANRIYLFDVDSPPNLVTEVATMESPLTEQFVP